MDTARSRRWFRLSSPWAVLVLALLVAAATTLTVGLTARARDRARFENAVQSAHDRIETRLDTYVAMLHGTAGLFAASERVSRSEFHNYVERLDLRGRYCGVRGIGFSKRLAASEVPGFVEATRGEGLPGFRVWPTDPRDEVHTIVYLEPLDARNRAALGYDMHTEPVRRAALDRAARTGEPSMSGRVTLQQEIDENVQPGFLIYVPVYRGGAVPETEAERLRALDGHVYAAFRADDMFADIFGTERQPRVAFRVYDGDPTAPEGLIHDSAKRTGAPTEPRFQEVLPLEAAGRTWTVVFSSLPFLEESSLSRWVPGIGVAGVLVSFLLFAVVRAQSEARKDAERSAAALAEREQRLEEAVQVRDDFLSMASHELKTPLTTLELLVSSSIARYQTRGEPPTLERLERVRKQIQRLEALIAQLLDVSRIVAGRLSPEPRELDLGALVEEVVERFGEQAARLGSPLRLSVAGPVLGSWDPDRIDQVVTNLISNALKYGAGQPVDVTVEATPGSARVVVRDRGRGIAPEDQQRIFDRFERAVSSKHFGGLGLGLWITRQIVDAHGGAVRVESAPGQGSRFIVELPRGGRRREWAQAPAAQRPATRL